MNHRRPQMTFDHNPEWFGPRGKVVLHFIQDGGPGGGYIWLGEDGLQGRQLADTSVVKFLRFAESVRRHLKLSR